MIRNLTSLALLVALIPAMSIALPTKDAQAKDGRNAAFVAGLAVGALGGAAFVHSNKYHRQHWTAPRNHYHRHFTSGWHYHNGIRHRHITTGHYRPVRVKKYYDRPKPWTGAWYRYCAERYRSFNARTGHFTTYSGKKRFCR
ncbi:MAG: BA14K family protein [Cohaesibacter sp.]|nr:BA14K family protein [Cohaesibacter sp.]